MARHEARYENWRDDFQSRLRTADQAMEAVHEGDLVGISIIAPGVLTAALEQRMRQVGRVDLRTLAPNFPNLFAATLQGEKEIEIFIGDGTRPAHDARIATYLPNTFMLGMKAFDNCRPEARMPDVFLTPCSEPNEAGYVHFGAHMWQRKSYARRCKTTIAAIDPNMQPMHGDIWVHVSEIAYFVQGAIGKVDIAAVRERIETQSPEADRPALLDLLSKRAPTRLHSSSRCSTCCRPRSLLRRLASPRWMRLRRLSAITFGALSATATPSRSASAPPSSLMFKAGAFDDAHHLGLHTELGSPGLARLWQRGILDGSMKTIHKNHGVAVAWTGCDGEDLNIIRDNPFFELYDPDYLLNPLLMGQNHQMTSINSAIAVDVLGQIASEDRFGGHMVNGTGGQPDTHISAALCANGRAITVMPSTALEGTLSKVVVRHDAGTLITIPRYLADTIVTEFGVARLLDKTIGSAPKR